MTKWNDARTRSSLGVAVVALAACGAQVERPTGGLLPSAPRASAIAPAAAASSARAPEPLATGLTPARAVRFRRISRLRFALNGERVAFVVSEVKGAANVSHVWMGDLRSGELRPFTMSSKSEFSPQWSPDGRRLAFLSTRAGAAQVFVMPIDGGEAIAATAAERGVSDFEWSPDGTRIAFLAAAGAEAKPDGPKLGDDAGELERIWIVGVDGAHAARQVTREPIRIDGFEWLSTDRLVVSATENPERETWHGALYEIRVEDGRRTPIAQPPQPFVGPFVSPKRTTVGYLAPRDQGPVPHDLFLGKPNLRDAADVTAAIDRRVVDVRWQNETTPLVAVEEGFRTVIHRVQGGRSVPIDMPHSLRTFDVAPDGTIAFVGVGFDRLPEVFVRRKDGQIRQLGRVQEGWDGIALAAPTMLRVPSFDGAPIEAALFQPPARAGASQKPPLVLLVHGGPSSRFAADYYWFGSWAQLLVARGYAVLLANPRGSTGYGEAFAKANRGDWGGGDYKDLIAVLDAVVARGTVDPERLGIGGWSYGAEMTAWAIGHTTRFKAAVAGAGVFDQAAEFGTEDDPAGDAWHLGTPWDNPDVFAKTSPSTFIQNAKTPTLLLHGEADRNNPVGQSKAFYRALKHFDVEARLVLYPGEPHGLRQEKHQIDALEQMLAWFDGHLK